MSQLKETIRADLKTSMKARDKERTGAIRALLAAILAEETAGARHEISDEDVLKVVAREIKKRRESAQTYADNDRPELAEAELAEIPYFETYQPVQLNEDEVEQLVTDSIAEVGADSMAQMGQVMRVATERAAGAVDGKRLSDSIKSKLSK